MLSLAKLNTLEYKLFRYLRDKLRSYVDQRSTAAPDAMIEKFIKEAKDLCKGFKPPHTLDFFMNLCVTSFGVITRGPNKDKKHYTDLLMRQFIHFCEEVLYFYESKLSPNIPSSKIVFDSKILDNQRNIDFPSPYHSQLSYHPKAALHPESEPLPHGQSDTAQEPKESKNTKNVKSLGNTIILIAPPCSLTKDAVEAFKNDFKYVEAK